MYGNYNLSQKSQLESSLKSRKQNVFAGSCQTLPITATRKGDLVSFHGSIVHNGYKYNEISEAALRKALSFLDKNEVETYQKAIHEWQNALKKDAGISALMEKGKTYGTKEEAVGTKLVGIVKNPVIAIKDMFKKKTDVVEDEVVHKVKHLEGLMNYIEYCEKKGKEVDIFDERIKEATGLKATFSNMKQATGIRIITGIIGAAYLASDNFNMVRSIDDDKEKANQAASSRLKQQAIRVGIGAYAIYASKYLFEKQCNKSLKIALTVALAAAFVPEVLSRLLTNKPIMPISKEEALKRGNAKPADNKAHTSQETKAESAPQAAQAPALKGQKPVAFKGGFLMKEINVPKSELKKVLDATKEISEKTYDRFLDIVKSELGVDLVQKLESTADNELISLGMQKNRARRILESFTSPVKPIIKLVNKILKKEEPAKTKIGFVQNYVADMAETLKGDPKNPKTSAQIIEELKKTKYDTFLNEKASYDSNKYSLWNKLLASTLSGFFVVSDDYNLTMQQSKGDEDLSKQNGRKRALQKVVSIGISSYIMTITGSLFAKQTNAKLAIAIGMAGFNNFAYETLTRMLIGQPIMPKDKKQLDELQQKNEKIKFYRVMGKIMGKKPNIGKKDNNIAVKAGIPAKPAQTGSQPTEMTVPNKTIAVKPARFVA